MKAEAEQQPADCKPRTAYYKFDRGELAMIAEQTNNNLLAPWTEKLLPSPTAELEAKVARMQREGSKVYRFGLGQPDFPTPPHAKQAAIDAINDNFTGYTDTAGILSLRQAVARSLQEQCGVHYEPDEIVVSIGGKHSLFNAINTLLQQGDEVLLPTPYWVSFPEQIKFAGGIPCLVETDASSGYKVTPDMLEQAVTSASKLLILNQPNNPSGAVYTRAELEQIAQFCIRHNLWVISDEVYSCFVFQEEGFTSIASLPGMKERTIVINAVSKSYSMTGWRIGYSASPAHVAAAMLKLQSHTTSNPASIAQAAALAALDGPQDSIKEMRNTYLARREVLVAGIRQLRGLKCLVPDGAFYVWVDASEWLGKTLCGQVIDSVDKLADVLLTEGNIAVMPGTGFGSGKHLRLSYAISMAEIEEGLEQLGKLLGYKL
ncbi:aminotransferase [Paenibacillus montaniterrae]|uniref:Aminotransferase n=1 Tax=Paenibacillus montaniterrae TaxID=429341 RepID=A0A919YNE3_9BACL|nr:pyridoxal phosphate-dependent aminotransferase [Paenibacillus montaniterrae]GIP17672.1 aminotransferase [Paenibacillus montaniterrae]